jgi:hypothetical protein
MYEAHGLMSGKRVLSSKGSHQSTLKPRQLLVYCLFGILQDSLEVCWVSEVASLWDRCSWYFVISICLFQIQELRKNNYIFSSYGY